MATIHNTTMNPTKLELLADWLPAQPWYTEPADTELTRAGGFRLDDPAGEVGIEFMVVRVGQAAYLVPMTYRGAPLDGAEAALIGTAEHGVLGTRWIYDGTADPVLIARFGALLAGLAEPQAQSQSDIPDPTVHIRPGDPGTKVVLRRALVAADEATTDEQIRGGGVTATWTLPSGERVRGVLASPAAGT